MLFTPVKDHRTNYVMDGDIDGFIDAYLNGVPITLREFQPERMKGISLHVND